jgi:hypothetical protein
MRLNRHARASTRAKRMDCRGKPGNDEAPCADEVIE